MSEMEQPDLIIEAYGTVTPPPDHTPDEENNDDARS
jgi:hypothetical protein